MSKNGIKIKKVKHKNTAKFWNNVPNNFQARYSLNYLMKKEHEFVARYRFIKDLNFILTNLPPRKNKMLDLGCRSGNYLNRLSDFFVYSEGIDFSETSTKIARSLIKKNKNVKIRCENVITARLEGKFDLINIGELLLYFNDNDLLRLFSNINHHLARQGKLILRESVASKYTVNYNKAATLTIRRSLAHYKKIFKKTGFRIIIIEKNYNYNFSWMAATTLGLIPSLLKNRKFINFYMKNVVTRFFCLYVPFYFLTLLKPNLIVQYYFVLQRNE